MMLTVKQNSVLAMTTGERRFDESEATAFILLEGELIVEHQSCDSCRYKTTVLTNRGSHIVIAPKTYHRLKNLKMERVLFIEVKTEFNQSE